MFDITQMIAKLRSSISTRGNGSHSQQITEGKGPLIKRDHSKMTTPYSPALWQRLPLEIRQQITLSILLDYLKTPKTAWKAHRTSFEQALRNLINLEDHRPHMLTYPLSKFFTHLTPETNHLLDDLALISSDLAKIWSRWTTYSLTTPPSDLEQETLDKEILKYTRLQRLKQLEDLEQSVLYLMRHIAPPTPEEKKRYKYLKSRRYTPDWKPVLLRPEELAEVSGTTVTVTPLARHSTAGIRVVKVCPRHRHLNSLSLTSAFRLLVEACHPLGFVGARAEQPCVCGDGGVCHYQILA